MSTDSMHLFLHTISKIGCFRTRELASMCHVADDRILIQVDQEDPFQLHFLQSPVKKQNEWKKLAPFLYPIFFHINASSFQLTLYMWIRTDRGSTHIQLFLIQLGRSALDVHPSRRIIGRERPVKWLEGWGVTDCLARIIPTVRATRTSCQQSPANAAAVAASPEPMSRDPPLFSIEI